MSLLYYAYVYLEFLILACTIYILAPTIVSGAEIVMENYTAAEAPELTVEAVSGWIVNTFSDKFF